MTIYIHRYTLVPRSALNALASAAPRSGALLRVDSGFADVHPWPELGDAPLDEQLALLARGELTPLTRRSLNFAAEDAAARRRGVSLFDGLEVPPSHFMRVGSEDVPAAFDTVKVKMRAGMTVDPELARFRLRLDFNGTLTAAEYLAFARALPAGVREAIDFVEDPVPYDAAVWRRLREESGLRLAVDRGAGEAAADVLVIKPALQEVPATEKGLVITSYMDHPVGQSFAAWVAARHGARAHRCGLLTHELYEANAFAERLRVDGMRLVPAAGTGMGFDDLLEALPWRRLA